MQPIIVTLQRKSFLAPISDEFLIFSDTSLIQRVSNKLSELARGLRPGMLQEFLNGSDALQSTFNEISGALIQGANGNSDLFPYAKITFGKTTISPNSSGFAWRVEYEVSSDKLTLIAIPNEHTLVLLTDDNKVKIFTNLNGVEITAEKD